MTSEVNNIHTKNMTTLNNNTSNMKNSKIFMVSVKGTTDTKKIHYVNANTKKQALETAKEIWYYVNHAEDVTNSHFSSEEKNNLPSYVIVAE